MERQSIFRMQRRFKLFTILIFFFCLLFRLATPPSCFGFQEDKKEATAEEQREKDSPKKLKSKQPWEILVNIPGAIFYFPFWLAYSGIKPVLSFLETSRFIADVEDFLVSNDGRRVTYPTSRSRTGLGLKFTYSDFLMKGDTLDLTATAGHRWSQYYSLSLQRISLGGLWNMTLGLRHQYLSTENFYGMGNDSKAEDLTHYSLRQSGGWLSINREPSSELVFGSTLGLEYNSVGPGHHPKNPSTLSLPLEIKREIPGLLDKISLAFLNFHLNLDTISPKSFATSGWMIFFKTGYYYQINGGTYSFVQSALDVRRYFHLFYERFLVFRMAGMMTRPLDFDSIPFYMLSQLGHRRSIRGYRLGRFRDRDRILGSMEYHFPLNKRPVKKISLSAYLFVDAGKVSSDLFKDSILNEYHLGYGGGLRIFNKSTLDIHLIFGHSREGLRFAVVINETEKTDIRMD
jgi:hypothetical protein